MRQGLSLAELLASTATTVDMLKTLRRRDQVALAFGQRTAFDNMTYLPIDTVGMLLRSTLAKIYGHAVGTYLTRVYADVWAKVVAEAEQHRGDASFAIIDCERLEDGLKATLALGAVGGIAPEQINKLLAETQGANGFIAVAINTVNISHLIRTIRIQAARHDIDLIAPFMPPPDSDEFNKLFAPFVEVRDNAIAVTAKERKKREELTRKAGALARMVAGQLQ